MVRVVLRDRYYIPVEAIDVRALRLHMEVATSDKRDCRQSCPLAHKQGRWCSTCPSKDRKVKMWERVVSRSGRVFVAVPAGDSRLVERVVLGRMRVVDARAAPPMRSKLRWTGRLRRGGFNVRGEREADQRGMLRAWHSLTKTETGGIIISPPRSGKCVVAGTIIRTERGYHPIEALFEGVVTEDTLGHHGSVAVAHGVSEIRGLHRRTTESVVAVLLQNGVELGGTPEHPIVVLDPQRKYRRMDELQVGDSVLMAPTCDPSIDPRRGLLEDEATMMGHIVACCDLPDLEGGLVDLSLALADYSEAADLIEVVKRVTGLRLGVGECRAINFVTLTRLKRWQRLLLESGDGAWRAFFCAAFASNFSDTPSLLLPGAIARAAHYHLLGRRVRAFLHPSPFGHVLVADRDTLHRYLGGRQAHSTPQGEDLSSPIVKVAVAAGRRVVYDLMVPETKSFVTNAVVSHNTVIGVGGVMVKRCRALITASQSKFLHQFADRFGELTNLRELAADGRHPVVLVDPKGWSGDRRSGVLVLKKWGPEVDRADVVLTAYQQLLNTERGRERVRRHVSGRFGTFVADETHQCAAPCFSRLANRSDARFKMGLTATLKRKDKMEPVVQATLGRVAAIGRVASTLPLIELLETGVGSAKKRYSNWSAMESFLARHEERNRIVVRKIFRDLRANPLHCVLLPVTRVSHNHDLVTMINQQAEFCRRNRGEDWPIDLAVPYKGGTDTTSVLNLVAAGKARVTVATLSMVKFGLDVPRWTHVYIGMIPTSNAANVYQALNRVCTPYTEKMRDRLGAKPQPVVRMIIDQMSASVHCFARVWKDPDYGLRGALSGKNYFDILLARARPEAAARMKEIAAYPAAYSAADVGVRQTLGKTRTGKQRRKSAWTPHSGGVTRL